MPDDACGLAQPPESSGPPPAGPAVDGSSAAVLLKQSFDRDSLYVLRAAVAVHATRAGLPPDRADDLVVAVHELAANVVRHGPGHGWLRMWVEPEALRCEVTEDGSAPGAGLADHPARREAAPWPVRHGHGLWLVRQVADQVSLHAGPAGGIATISFRLALPGHG